MRNVSHGRSQKCSDGSTHLDDPLLLDVEGLEILPRRRRARQNPVLNGPNTLNVVVDSLKALVAACAQILVRLLGVVQVREALPLDDVPLENEKNDRQRGSARIDDIKRRTRFCRGRSSGSLSLSSSLMWPTTSSISSESSARAGQRSDILLRLRKKVKDEPASATAPPPYSISSSSESIP